MEHDDSTIRVLLVEDDEEDYFIVRNLFRNMSRSSFKLDWTSSFDEATRMITDEKHDIYLIDYRLGPATGLELLAQFNVQQRTEPFIVLTGVGDENIEREAMEQGAADYLVKGRFDTELLERVLLYSLQRKQSEAQRVGHLMELNRSKDDFIALASHQLRTPATAVKQYLGMILQGYAGEVAEDHRSLLTHAYNSNERQLQIVEDLLRTARLDMEKVILHKAQTDIGELMEKAITDIDSFLQERNQTVSYTKPTYTVQATVDANYLRMAIGNILDNASKYTPPGKHIFVKVDQQGKNGRHEARVIIRDQGVGISTADIPQLFKKFSRIHNPLSIQVGGTGLGLYWAQKVVNLHGGIVQVRSRLNTGSTFTIVLPINH